MKKSAFILLAAVTAVCLGIICVSVLFTTAEQKDLVLSLPEGFTVTGHSASEGTAENSVDSILVCAENADITEFDLNFTEDGMPVLSHNAPKGNETTLEEAFTELAKHSQLKANIDLKSTANLPEVFRLAEEYDVMDQIFFTGVEVKDVQRVNEDCPGISYYLNVNDIDKKKLTDSNYLLILADDVAANGAIGINLHKKNVSRELIEMFHSKQLLVSVWTVNSKRDMYSILSLGPDNITTKKPVTLAKIIKEVSDSE